MRTKSVESGYVKRLAWESPFTPVRDRDRRISSTSQPLRVFRGSKYLTRLKVGVAAVPGIVPGHRLTVGDANSEGSEYPLCLRDPGWC